MGKFFPKMITMLGSKDLPVEKKVELFIENYLNIIVDNPFIPAFIIGELNRNPQELADFIFESGIETTQVPFIIGEVISKELGITPQQVRHLIVNIVALCVFPFVARPLLERIIFQSNTDDFNQFILERKKVITEMIINSLALLKS
jgi:hypothetical protein